MPQIISSKPSCILFLLGVDPISQASLSPCSCTLFYMSGLSILSILLILTLICSTPTLEARKLLSMEKKTESALEDSLILTVLPKGRTTAPPSFPSGSGHAMALTEKLFKIHLAKLDRVLQSVPSPGVGH